MLTKAMMKSHSKRDVQQEKRLVEENLRLVSFIVKSLRPPNQTEYEEYVQHGMIGLWQAAITYDETKASFVTHAYNNIKWEVIRYIKKTVNKLDKEKEYVKNYEKEELANIEDIKEYLPNSLSEVESSVVRLRYEGYTFSEIGSQLGGYTKGWVNSKFKKAKKKILKANEKKTNING